MKGDVSVLLVGLIRPLIWMVGMFVATTYRNWPAFFGCLVFAITSFLSSFIFAGYELAPIWGLLISAFSITGALALVYGMLLSARNMKLYHEQLHRLDRWKLDEK